MASLNIGMIGAGYIGNVHAGILSRDERVRLTAIYDILPERSHAFAQAFGASVANSIDALIEKVDAVYIATPNTTHVEVTLKAVNEARHVFCEKPLATSLEQARQVLEACRQSSKVFQVGHNRRFAPVYQEVKKLIAEEGMEPHSVHAKMNRGELLNPYWVNDTSVTGGFLYETPVHMFDLLRWFFGEVESVLVYATAHQYPEMDDFSILFRFRNGLHTTMVTAADASWHFPFERLELFCRHATIETLEMDRLCYTIGLNVQTVSQSFDQLGKDQRWGYEQEDRAFIDAILSGQQPPVTALDGYKAVELVDACYRSAQTAERVLLTTP